MTALPSIFISHGSPMHALQPGPAGEAWKALGSRLPRPRAILIASAHWETSGGPAVSLAPQPETIHDFGGFPPALQRKVLKDAAPLRERPGKSLPDIDLELVDEERRDGLFGLRLTCPQGDRVEVDAARHQAASTFSIRASKVPSLTCAPSSASSSAIMPSNGAVRLCSIFIASRVSSF